MVTARQSIK